MFTNRKIKVAYILATHGGMLHYLVELANAMSNYADVTVLAPKEYEPGYFSPNVKVLKVLDASMKKRSSVFRKIFSLPKLRLLKKLKPDIIHLTDFQPIIAFGLYYYRLHRKCALVYTDHDVLTGVHSDKTTEKLRETLGGFLNKRLVNYDKFIVHGNSLKDCMVKKGVPSDKIAVIPHGSYNLFANLKFEKTIAEEKNTILFFGRILKYKGLEYLVRAVPIIQSEIPDLHVIIAGEGDLTSCFGGQIPSPAFEIHNSIIPDDKVHELFSRSQLLVLPYVNASQSGPLHIALAMGKPVVATSVGSIPEVIKHGKNGLLAHPKDEKSLADAIITLLKDDKLRKIMGENSYEMARNELSWDIISKKTLDLYKEVLENRSEKTQKFTGLDV